MPGLSRSPARRSQESKKCETAPTGKMAVVDGRFRIGLDDACVDAVHADSDLWIEVVVEGEPLGRVKLGAVPYAVEAARAAAATGPLQQQIGALQQQLDGVGRPSVTLASTGK